MRRSTPTRREPAEPAPSKPRKERTPLALPRINPRIAAALTGAVVGLVGVVLSFGASQGCEAVRGVGSCGGIGLFALLAVLTSRSCSARRCCEASASPTRPAPASSASAWSP